MLIMNGVGFKIILDRTQLEIGKFIGINLTTKENVVFYR